MQRNKQNEISWQYLAGFYDGEGTVGLKVVKEKRPSRIKGETGGWYLSPYLQITNTNLEVLRTTQRFLHNKGIISHIISKIPSVKHHQRAYYLTIQSYEGIKEFFENISLYSLIKGEQMNLINKFFSIRDKLPTLKRGTRIDNLKRNYWTKKLFLKAMKLRDDLKNTKFRKKTRHKYNYAYFQKLWS